MRYSDLSHLLCTNKAILLAVLHQKNRYHLLALTTKSLERCYCDRKHYYQAMAHTTANEKLRYLLKKSLTQNVSYRHILSLLYNIRHPVLEKLSTLKDL